MSGRNSACAVLLACANPLDAQPWTAVRLHPETAQFSYCYAVGRHQQGGSLLDAASFSGLPVIWQGTSASWAALSGTGGTGDVYAIWGDAQAGDATGRASLWMGTAQSRVDLHPAGAVQSSILAMRAGMEAGYVFYGSNIVHAGFWRGTAASYVDLHPAGAVCSYANATDGALQGGFVDWQNGLSHAVRWSGSVQSLVDLNPPGATSGINGMAPGVQVGSVILPGETSPRAAVWHGTAQSVADFSGPQLSSIFFATTGRIHVGDGGSGSAAHALVNFGSSSSWLDLHQFLPAGYNSFSTAYAVYQDGPAIYVGGYASNAQGGEEAFLWMGADPCYPNCDQSTTPPVLNVLDFVCFLNAFAAGEGYANCDGSTTPPVLNVLDFACFINRFVAGCS